MEIYFSKRRWANPQAVNGMYHTRTDFKSTLQKNYSICMFYLKFCTLSGTLKGTWYELHCKTWRTFRHLWLRYVKDVHIGLDEDNRQVSSCHSHCVAVGLAWPPTLKLAILNTLFTPLKLFGRTPVVKKASVNSHSRTVGCWVLLAPNPWVGDWHCIKILRMDTPRQVNLSQPICIGCWVPWTPNLCVGD